MAIISFTNYKRGQTTGCMGAVMRYTMQDKKTRFEDRRLVTGINCQPESVYADFMTTKRLYHKEGGTMFYHMVQSFPKDEVVDPAAAHAAALKLAEYYEGFEVLVCTHTDREHVHSHFLINSVNFDTGRKLHIAKEQLQELRQRNDQVCMEFALPVFQPRKQKQKTKTMTIGEYHTAARGQSKKLQLMNIINDCMRHASSRDEFIALMESEGYKVRWEKSRRNITYTTPSGWQCRDRLLFGDKYLKENMEYEFRIREEIIRGRTHGEEPSRAYTAKHSVQCGDPVPNAGNSSSQAEYLRQLTEMRGWLPTRMQVDELTKAVAELRWAVDRVGNQNEKSFSLPKLKLPRPHLPRLSPAFLLILAVLAALWVMWYSLDALWNGISMLNT